MNITSKVGYYSSVTAAIAVIAFTVVQILQVAGAVTKPLDDVLIYTTSLCIAPPFVLAMLALYHNTPPSKKLWAHAALVFAIMYSVFVTIMYVVQLATVIPYHVSNTALTVTPHSFFWTLDALGYMHMGIATLFAAQVFGGHSMNKRVKLFLLLHACTTPLIALVYFYPTFSVALLVLASPWSITATVSLLLLAMYFKNAVPVRERVF